LPTIKNLKTSTTTTGNDLALPFPTSQDTIKHKEGTAPDGTEKPEYIEHLNDDIFIKDEDGYLVSQTTDYKGKSRKQQQERFCLLYVWGHFKVFKKGIGKKQIIEGAKRNGLFDNNLQIYFKNVEQFLTKTNDVYRLNPAGQTRISQIIGEMQDDDVKGFIYWEAPKPRAKRASGSKEETKKVEQWLTQSSDLEQYDVRKLNTYTDICMFTLYDLTKILKVVEAVKPSSAYKYVKTRYKTLTLTTNQFASTLRRKENEEKFQKTADGLYFLTELGENIIKGIINQGNPQF
jgi:hypothetical protein